MTERDRELKPKKLYPIYPVSYTHLYRMPSLILADGMLGQMMEPVEFPESNCHTKEKTWALTGHKNKRPPNIVNSLYLNPSELEQTILSRFERYRIIEEREAVAESLFMEDAQYAVTAYGIAARVVKSAVQAAREEGIKVGLIRPITVWPFPQKEFDGAETLDGILCVELSMGQMVEDVRLAVNGRCPVEFIGRTGGLDVYKRQLPDELNPHIWCLRSESNQRHGDFQSPALPTELQRRTGR